MSQKQPEAQDENLPAVALERDAGSSLGRDGKAINHVLAAQHNSHASSQKTVAYKAASAATAAPAAPRAGITSTSEPDAQPSITACCADAFTQSNSSILGSNGKQGLHRIDQLGEGDQQQRVALGSFAEMRIALPEALPRLAQGPAGEALNSNGSGNSGTSPSQQRPRGWQAMLCPSPRLDQEGSSVENVEGFDAAGTSGNLNRRLPPPLIAYGSAGDSCLAGTQPGSSARESTSEPELAAERAVTVNSSKAGRPAPLTVPAVQSNMSSPDPQHGIADHADNGFQPGVAPAQAGDPEDMGGSPGAAGQDDNSLPRGTGGAQQHRRMTVVIPSCEPPLSPLPQTPSSARPYSGPTLYADELDLEAIDGVSVDSLGISASSSPSTTAPGSAASGSSFGGRSSAGLRTSRDHDLRRAALMNHMLSPRPNAPMSVSDTGTGAMFTGSCSRPRGSGGQQQAGETVEAAAPDIPAGGAGSTNNEEALQLMQVLRLSRGPSPSLTSSPITGGPGSAPGSILGSVRSRSLPGTPAGLAPAVPAPGSSRGTSMGSSPLAPPLSQGGAAALLAGSVVASPRTPRSPLSIVFSPRSGQRSVGHAPGASLLPPPLFHTSGGCISNSNSSNTLGSTDSPVTAGPGNSGVPPAGRHAAVDRAAGGMGSPPSASSSLQELDLLAAEHNSIRPGHLDENAISSSTQLVEGLLSPDSSTGDLKPGVVAAGAAAARDEHLTAFWGSGAVSNAHGSVS
eukprot:gene4973-5214_t